MQFHDTLKTVSYKVRTSVKIFDGYDADHDQDDNFMIIIIMVILLMMMIMIKTTAAKSPEDLL